MDTVFKRASQRGGGRETKADGSHYRDDDDDD